MQAVPILKTNTHTWLLSRAGQAMFSQVLRRAARFVFLLLAAKKLGPEVFGSYVLFLAIMETLSLMTGEGLTDFVAREVAKNASATQSLFNRVVAIRWLLTGIFSPVAVVTLYLLHYPPQLLWCATLMLTILFSRGPFAAAQGLFRSANRMGLLLWLEGTQAGVLLAFGTYGLLHAPTLRTVVLAESGAALAVAVVATLLVKATAGNGSARIAWRTLWKAAAIFNVFPLITNIYDRVDVVLLSVIAGTAAAGFYALPYRVLTTLQIIPFGLMAVVLPVLAAQMHLSTDKQFCLRMATILGALSMCAALVVSLLAKPLVQIILGGIYIDSAKILQVVIWAAIPMFINYGLNTFLLARDSERVFLITNSVCAIANIALNLVLIPRYGYFAAAAVTIATELLLLVQNLTIIWKRFAFLAVPQRLWITTGVLLFLVAVAQVAGRHVSPLLVAAPACLVFALVLYLDGSLREIRESMGPVLRSA